MEYISKNGTIPKGGLIKFGYRMKYSQAARRKAIDMAMKEFDHDKVVNTFIFLYNNSGRYEDVVLSDLEYSRTFL